MDKERSISLSARIGSIIASEQPKINYTENDIKRARADFSQEDIDEMVEIGLLAGYSDRDFEEFFVIREFCAALGLSDADDDGRYTLELFKSARMYDADEFENDPFIRGVNIRKARKGKILLTESEYERGEIFLYDMPNFSERLVVPKIAFFPRRVTFPALYEDVIPWVSVCPSEINSMREQIEAAHGRVLVLGLGLGYYPFIVSQSPSVESITIVELQDEVIDIFKENLLPQFPCGEKIRIVKADATEYIKGVDIGDFDFCFADIWEGALDGAPLYLKIKEHEKRLENTEFTYWIKDQIEAYLSD